MSQSKLFWYSVPELGERPRGRVRIITRDRVSVLTITRVIDIAAIQIWFDLHHRFEGEIEIQVWDSENHGTMIGKGWVKPNHEVTFDLGNVIYLGQGAPS